MEDIIKIPTRSLPWLKLIALTTSVGAGVGTAIATTLGFLNNDATLQQKLMEQKIELTKEWDQIKKDKDYFDGIKKENEKLKAENTRFNDIKQKYDNCKDLLIRDNKLNCIVPTQ